MNIWVVRIQRLDPITLERQEVMTFRVAAKQQDDVDSHADEVLNKWLRMNPGRLGTWSISRFIPKRQDA